ncbi:MAG: adenine-specific methyltransferase EcoRI family protein [Clostridia bacterium]
MGDNKSLRKANNAKQDEFYTQLSDIEQELRHYKEDFRGKTVFCNCDDPYESNFFKYFAINFNHLGLKKLIATCFDTSPIAGQEIDLFNFQEAENYENRAYKIEITEITDLNNDGAVDMADVKTLLKNDKNTFTILKGNGDFRSEECVKLLMQADIIVTNPPFSLFREYISLLEQYNKKYIVIGNTNALTYKEIFGLFKDNKIRTGYTNFNVGMFFSVPNTCVQYHKIVDGKKYVRVSTSCWFTNLSVSKHSDFITLYKKYNKDYYPKYQNFDAINVNKYTDIPCDYFGYIGVPITFLDKYNPEQFLIIGLGISNSGLSFGVAPYVMEHKKYRKEVQHKGAVDGDLYLLDSNGHPDVPYARIIIKRKEGSL